MKVRAPATFQNRANLIWKVLSETSEFLDLDVKSVASFLATPTSTSLSSSSSSDVVLSPSATFYDASLSFIRRRKSYRFRGLLPFCWTSLQSSACLEVLWKLRLPEFLIFILTCKSFAGNEGKLQKGFLALCHKTFSLLHDLALYEPINEAANQEYLFRSRGLRVMLKVAAYDPYHYRSFFHTQEALE